MAISKVVYGEQTLLDVSEDTVTSGGLIFGTTAHNAAGDQIIGNLIISNKNLLDNPFYTVNQRNVSGTVTGNKYVFDRWRNYNTESLSVSGNTATFKNGTLYQILENNLAGLIVGKVCTGSIKLSDGTVLGGNSVINNTGETTFYNHGGIKVNLEISSSQLKFNIASSNGTEISIVAAKFEFGSVSTLANDVAPDYAAELLKCQRYFIRKAVTGSGYVSNGGNNRYVTLDLPVPMRINNPTVSFSGTIVVRGDVGYDTVFPSGGGTPSSVNIYQGATIPRGNISISFVHNTKSNITNNTPICIASQNAYVDISADL